jgi:hypothetical protein
VVLEILSKTYCLVSVRPIRPVKSHSGSDKNLKSCLLQWPKGLWHASVQLCPLNSFHLCRSCFQAGRANSPECQLGAICCTDNVGWMTKQKPTVLCQMMAPIDPVICQDDKEPCEQASHFGGRGSSGFSCSKSFLLDWSMLRLGAKEQAVFIIVHCFWATLDKFMRKELAKKNNKTWFQNTFKRAWKKFQKPVYNWGLITFKFWLKPWFKKL